MNFASDNASGVAPAILEAIVAANPGTAPAYGADTFTQRAEAALSEIFERPVASFLVSTGTAANALALGALTPPWSAIFCHEEAHIHDDECGAPELFTGGAKLVGIPGDAGKITPAALRETLARFPRGLVKSVQPGALSLSQATEAGTIYTPDEIAALSAIAHDAGHRRAYGRRAFRQCAGRARLLAGGNVLARPASTRSRSAPRRTARWAARRWCSSTPNRPRISPFSASAAAIPCRKGASSARRWRPISTDGLWLTLARRANDAAKRLADGLAAIPARAPRLAAAGQ